MARARPVTSHLPLCTVISQSQRRVATIQPLTRLYLRANDFYSTPPVLYAYLSTCACTHTRATRVSFASKLQKTGMAQWSPSQLAFFHPSCTYSAYAYKLSTLFARTAKCTVFLLLPFFCFHANAVPIFLSVSPSFSFAVAERVALLAPHTVSRSGGKLEKKVLIFWDN